MSTIPASPPPPERSKPAVIDYACRHRHLHPERLEVGDGARTVCLDCNNFVAIHAFELQDGTTFAQQSAMARVLLDKFAEARANGTLDALLVAMRSEYDAHQEAYAKATANGT
jgi:hypothetical protein